MHHISLNYQLLDQDLINLSQQAMRRSTHIQLDGALLRLIVLPLEHHNVALNIPALAAKQHLEF